MARRPKAAPPQLDLFDYLFPAPPPAAPARSETPMRVTDDWPEFVPISDIEVRTIEAFFADVLDELFGPIP